ncbi:hypothetical protein L2E82_40685 [Cichorium intybus]|uniref:Uncharacterized protein n=1 Tax=Cichorium intybus TaxID=13427 RepID=A0ACB9AR26_CICIN|nr:hypothetical protein L2E82_40685 [Cichorium intybus]
MQAYKYRSYTDTSFWTTVLVYPQFQFLFSGRDTLTYQSLFTQQTVKPLENPIYFESNPTLKPPILLYNSLSSADKFSNLFVNQESQMN